MTQDPTTPSTPPITKPSATVPAPPAPPAGVSRRSLIWIGVAVVVLSFIAAFLGSWLARSLDSADPEPTPTPTASETASPDYEEILSEILPAGSAVRAGTGAPESGKGYEGDVYIDRSTADVYVFQDDWVWAGNIRENAAENLTGETGATGEQGPTGEQGEAGEPGTQVLLGVGAPVDETCEADGDVYIDTEVSAYYECVEGTWTLFGPTPPAEPETQD